MYQILYNTAIAAPGSQGLLSRILSSAISRPQIDQAQGEQTYRNRVRHRNFADDLTWLPR